MAGVMEEIAEKMTLDTARKLLQKGKMTFEEIAECCSLPLEKIQELAAGSPAQVKDGV